jgi:hypothetical protein
VPETSTPLGTAARPMTGLICSSCRRTPDDAKTMHPVDLLQPWVGGRRRREVQNGKVTYVGSSVDTTPVPVV